MKVWRERLAALLLMGGPILGGIAFFQRRPSPLPAQPATAASPARGAPARRIASVPKWHEVERRLGRNLTAKFDGDRLVEIQGSLEDGLKSAKFSPEDKQRVAARASEVARWIAPFVNVPQDEWSRARVVTGPRSAQVYFEQSREGLALFPPGIVSMDFGPAGQLLSLSTRLFEGLEIQGEEKIPHTLAESIAREGVSEAVPTSAGRRILWIPHPDPSGDRTVAYRAYEFFVGPRQILVNATTGHVISKRDRGIR